VTDTMIHDYSDVTRLDDHFAEQRAQELKLKGEAQRAEHEAHLGAVRNERIRKMGLAALAAGAGIGLACFGASFMIAPKERIAYTPGPERVVTRDVAGPVHETVRTVVKEVPGPERVVTRDVPGPERIVKVPEYVTPKEKDFTERPEYRSAQYKGHLVADADGLIRFITGKAFYPQKLNSAGLLEIDDGAMYETTPYLGDLAYCNDIPGSEAKTANHTRLANCLVIHKDVVIDLNTTYKQKSAKADPPPASESCPKTSENGLPVLVCGAVNMISVDVDLGANSSIKAMVDTGCAFPMALPDGIAANLLQNRLATLAGNTRVTLATGKTESVTVIMINRVTVDGRTLHGVEAVVAKGNDASILLGLGALNQLGPFKIDDGKLVFTGEQPT
jgi:hypothetical protein